MRAVQAEKGIKTKTLEEEPIIAPHLRWIWKAFCDLNSRRPVAGMGGALPFSYTEIEAYCRLKGIYALGERERLLHFLDLLDREWLKAYIEKERRENPTPSSLPPPSHSPPRVAPRRPRTPTQV